MQRWSRRRALHAVAATASVALAGCTDSTEQSDPTTANGDSAPVTGNDVEMTRDPRGRRLFWETDEQTAVRLLTDPPDESALTFAESVSAATELRAFAADSDFETESVVLFATRLSACRHLQFVGVSRGSDHVDVSLCEALRPADAVCEHDADHTAGVAVRLPFAADTDETSVQISGDCRETAEPVTLSGSEQS
ncbi:hypothetical protein [Halobacterium jilantaiense]|uniref:Uncharacterized protein n=1 Tax=Halobacterium jilantaiense TaxID=355548 RepID=A0A1I0ML11_9EURY|nr:hypothetical protein [Halobacterium jilantaiense]SEV89125.1 hypothetical protein SAMN04487945_0169 [Halobacterium jilantaiense]